MDDSVLIHKTWFDERDGSKIEIWKNLEGKFFRMNGPARIVT